MMQHEMQHDTPHARIIPKLSRGSTPLGSTNYEKPALRGFFHFIKTWRGF